MPTFWKRIFVLLLAALMLSGCGLWDEESWNQKVTVEVQTPNGLVTGSSVQRVDYSKANFNVVDAADRTFTPTGEAVVVDLGKTGKLFALLKGETHLGNAATLAPIAFFGLGRRPGYGSSEAIETVIAQPEGSTVELPRSAYPLLVTFTDINDPATLKLVDPDDLESSFGLGTKLKQITLTVTGEPVTEGKLEQVLSWMIPLGRERGRIIPKPAYVQGARALSDMTTEELVTPGDFLSAGHWSE